MSDEATVDGAYAIASACVERADRRVERAERFLADTQFELARAESALLDAKLERAYAALLVERIVK